MGLSISHIQLWNHFILHSARDEWCAASPLNMICTLKLLSSIIHLQLLWLWQYYHQNCIPIRIQIPAHRFLVVCLKFWTSFCRSVGGGWWGRCLLHAWQWQDEGHHDSCCSKGNDRTLFPSTGYRCNHCLPQTTWYLHSCVSMCISGCVPTVCGCVCVCLWRK